MVLSDSEESEVESAPCSNSNSAVPMALKQQKSSPLLDLMELEELKISMESLLATLKCPVCLVLVEKDSILCVKGHATCRKCQGNQKSCPTCRCTFSNLQQNVIFSQIVEIIPHRCRFDKCTDLVKTGEDHEEYCRFRPTQCKYSGCKWVGSVNNLSFHVEDKHPQEKIYTGKKNLVKVSKSFVNSIGTLLFSAGDHYFWQLNLKCNPEEDNGCDSVRFFYLPLWAGKPTRDVYIRIWFNSEEKEYEAGIKIKMNQNNDVAKADSFIFPSSMITNFYNGSELKYHLLITEERNEAIITLLE